MPENDNQQSITRRQARSERVSYGDPVVLHESSISRIVLVPFFVPRTGRTELAVKIQSYRKGAPPLDWVLVEDKSVSLPEVASRVLLSAVQRHLAVAEQTSADGSYIVIPVTEGVADIGRHEPAAVARALVRVLGQRDIVAHLAGTNLDDQLVTAMRGAIRLREMQTAVAQLRTLLDEGETAEQPFQSWCEKNAWAFGNAYVIKDEVREISPGDNLDLLLPTVIAGYRDIVELKRSDAKVLRWDDTHRNFYFSADTSRALGQCHRYLDVLHEVAQHGLRDHPEIVAYHPRAIVVIGRSNDWGEEKLKALHGLNARLNGITVMTYDHLLNQGERLVQMLSAAAAVQQEDHEGLEIWDESDDIPF
jgi:hypothetical protein